MWQSVTSRRLARSLARASARAARRPDRATRRRDRGQTLVIFVLVFTALIGFLGLAIDTARVYDLYARMQRAAEAGALAGVIYMPTYYTNTLPSSPYDNAICRALQETSKDGFGTYCDPSTLSPIPATPCPTPQSTIEIAVCPTSQPHQLQVFITESINLTFLSALGLGGLTLTVSATADYIPPVNVGVDPTNPGGTGTWGTFGSCGYAASSACSTGVRNWAGNINGPGELKEQGDPLVTCEEGSSGLDPANASNYGSIDTNAASTISPPSTTPYTTYTGLPTNHPQYTDYTATSGDGGQVPANCANSDQSIALTGPAYMGGPQHVGYAFYVNIPANDPGEDLWVWNAPFSPNSGNSCNGRTGGQNQTSYDVFYFYNCKGSSHSPYYFYPGTASGLPCNSTVLAPSSLPNNNPYQCEDPNLYFTVSYTIYSIADSADPAPISGQPVTTFTALPYEVNDISNCDWQPHSSFYSSPTAPGGCVASDCIAKWCPVANRIGDTGSLWSGVKLGPGKYRVMVVAADYGDPSNFNMGWGGHSYSLRLCPDGTTQGNVPGCTPYNGAYVAGWSLTDALFAFPGNGKGNGSSQTTEYPLGYIGQEYAGETINVQLYDPGDLNGTNSSAKGYTIYAVAPPLAPGASTSDPCLISSSDLALAGFSSSSYFFPYHERPAAFSSALTGLEGSYNGDLLYNGLWTSIQVTMPSTYTGGDWTLCAIAPQTNDSDVVGVMVDSLNASPVHLTGS